MGKNILIIYSDYTGYGHKSILDSLNEQFVMHPDINVFFLDGFALGGNFGIMISKLHSSITRNAKELWRLIWKLTYKRPSLACEITELAIHDNFLKAIERIKPDLILSVHPNFNGSVLNILKELNLNIPFVTFVADLVDVSPMWADPRADFIICPTRESRYKCIEFNVPQDKIRVFGFPIRSKFKKAAIEHNRQLKLKRDKPLEFLIMSGGEGSGNMGRVAKILLDNFNCNVKLIAGRNKAMKRRLNSTFSEKYGNRVEVCGFIENIEELMSSSDILFSRGSPNVIMEAVTCNLPIVITNALPGQEAGNPHFVQKNNLGVVCKELKNLKVVVSELLENNGRKIKNIKRSQRDFMKPDIAKNIVEFILKVEKTEKEEVIF